MWMHTVVAFLFLWILISRWQRRKMIRLAAQLKSRHTALPLVGHAYMFLGNDEDRMKALQVIGKDALEKGGVVSHWQGDRLFLAVADPVVADIVLKSCLEKDDITRFFRELLGNGSIFAPVSIWRPRRKKLAPTFSLKKLYHFVAIFSQKSTVMVDMLQKVVDSGKISVWKYFTSYSMDSVCETTLGTSVNSQLFSDQPFVHAFEESCRIGAARVFQPWYYNNTIFRMLPQYKEFIIHRKLIRDFIEKIINKKSNEIKTKLGAADLTNHNSDGLKTFLESLMKSAHGADGCSNLQLQEETLVLILAGTDTSAVAMSFTTVMLAIHPDVQEKVYEELREVFGDSNRPVVAEDLPRLKYLEATIKETMRLYPPVPFIVRKVEKDLLLPSGLTIVEGCGVFISMWSLHRNPKYWGEDAEQFRPERFIGSTLTHPAAFIPFSHGPRSCLGYQYAMMSIKTALATLLRQYKAISPEDTSYDPKKPLRVKYDIMLRHADDFVIQLQPRS